MTTSKASAPEKVTTVVEVISVPGPKGDIGPSGKDGAEPSDERLLALIQKTINENPNLKGPQGDPGRDSTVEGPRGPRGRDAVATTQLIEEAVRAVIAEQRDSLRGEPGSDSTVAGPSGRDGKDAVPPSRELLKELVLDVFEENKRDLRGPVGPASNVPGPPGETKPPTEAQVKALIAGVVKSMPALRGPAGESVVGPPGPSGLSGSQGPAGPPGVGHAKLRALEERVELLEAHLRAVEGGN